MKMLVDRNKPDPKDLTIHACPPWRNSRRSRGLRLAMRLEAPNGAELNYRPKSKSPFDFLPKWLISYFQTLL
jgi:hypothetical protein